MSLRALIETEKGGRAVFWELNESVQEAEDLLRFTPPDRSEYAAIRNEKRRKEWLASRLALRNGLGIDATVLYHPTGQPYIDSPVRNISFSHCIPLAGVVVHPSVAGMDIQSTDPKLIRIKEKYASQQELEDARASGDELTYLTVVWTIKEAIFKVYGSQLPFAEGIHVPRFNLNQSLHKIEVMRLKQPSTHLVQSFRVCDHWVALVTA